MHRQRAAEGSGQAFDRSIVRRRRDERVELPRQLTRVAAVAERPSGVLSEVVQRREVVVARARTGERDGAELDDQPRLHDVLRRDGLHGHHVGHRLADVRAGRSGHEGAAARADLHLDERHRLERAERVAHRDAADAELFRELTLGWQPLSLAQSATEDRVSNLLGDRGRGPRDRDRGEDVASVARLSAGAAHQASVERGPAGRSTMG
jgi:hypothetical protein